MATNANWTVIFDDKRIIKKTGSDQGFYQVNDDAFWNQAKFSNIWAIQYGTSVSTDEVEYRDETPHSSYADANLGDFQQFIDKWDATHLVRIQEEWDNTPGNASTGVLFADEAEKIATLGPRPTSYSS
jgi:hypothetical protein